MCAEGDRRRKLCMCSTYACMRLRIQIQGCAARMHAGVTDTDGYRYKTQCMILVLYIYAGIFYVESAGKVLPNTHF